MKSVLLAPAVLKVARRFRNSSCCSCFGGSTFAFSPRFAAARREPRGEMQHNVSVRLELTEVTKSSIISQESRSQ